MAFSLATLASNSFAQSPVVLVSLSTSGSQGNDISIEPSLTANGRIVAFNSFAGNFYAADTNGGADVYVRNFDTGVTICASVDRAGDVGYFGAFAPSLSADGRFVAFYSANILVPGASGWVEVFLRDLSLGVTWRACLGVGGAPMTANSVTPKISGDGQRVVFASDSTTLVPNDVNGTSDVFLYDHATATVTLVSQSSTGQPGNSASYPGLDISDDGRWVVFSSFSTNLVVGDNNGTYDAFVRDLATNTTTRVSVDSNGGESNGHSGVSGTGDVAAISNDGRFVGFRSTATNLVPGDTNNLEDIFVHDRVTGATRRVNVSSSGAQAPPLTGSSGELDLSGDGRYVVFQSDADNLVLGDSNNFPDIFVHDRATAQTRRVNISQLGATSMAALSAFPAISSDGRVVAFTSNATNLVPIDINGWVDVFAVEHQVSQPVVYCTAKLNSQNCLPAISFSGSPSASSGAAFDVQASNVLANRIGSLIYSTTGLDAIPFAGGWLCSAPPQRLTPLQLSGGVSPCGGSYDFEFNALIAGGLDPALIAGQSVWCQYWSRDPANHFKTNLTNAVHFLIQL